MDERAALRLLADALPAAGDDAAVVDGQVLTTDMLHETADFPGGTTRYTAGWRAVGASLSDLAGMGAAATAAVAVYAAPAFEPGELRAFLRGAREVCALVDAEYVGGDLDDHDEFTVATTALGATEEPARRSDATPGEAVCVTGMLGRSAAALELFEHGDAEAANELFRFEPRVAAGRAIAPHAGAMMDSSDGLARSLHQLAEASDCGFAISSDRVPVSERLDGLVADPLGTALTFGEDFELVFTAAEEAVDAIRDAAPVPVAVLGEVTRDAVRMDGEPLADEGYTH